MSSKTVTQLTETTTVDTGDVLHIVDVSANQDKKIKVTDLWNAKPYGELYMNGNATATTISVAGTQVNMTTGGATTTSGIVNKFTHDSANGRLTYTGEDDAVVEIIASASIGRVSVNDNRASMSIAVNGTPLTKSEVQWYVSQNGASPSGRRVGVCTCLTTLSENDYVEVFVGNEDDTDNQVVAFINMNIKSL